MKHEVKSTTFTVHISNVSFGADNHWLRPFDNVPNGCKGKSAPQQLYCIRWQYNWSESVSVLPWLSRLRLLRAGGCELRLSTAPLQAELGGGGYVIILSHTIYKKRSGFQLRLLNSIFRGGWKFVNQTPVGVSGGILPPKILLWFSHTNEAFWCIRTK